MPPEHLRPTTADGEVIGVDGTQPSRELAEGLTIRLQADADEPVAVQLAPGWYLRENGIGYGPSERMVVRGKRAMRGGQPVIIATEVEQGERRVPLRDESGRPLWKQTTPEE